MKPIRALATGWTDYTLIDSGRLSPHSPPMKLERFGAYNLARPEPGADWEVRRPRAWEAAQATFRLREGDRGDWTFHGALPERWPMEYTLSALDGFPLRFMAAATPYRHVGVFPEQASQWEWVAGLIRRRTLTGEPVRVLNLFGYTGLATLAAAAAGASVTHVDSSKKAVNWGRENQTQSGLAERPVRWIVEDALKYAEREVRRGARYEGVLFDPPPFGHGPKGEVWQFGRSIGPLLDALRALLSPTPLFVVLTAYTQQTTVEALASYVAGLVPSTPGLLEGGHLVAQDGAGRELPLAMVARWETEQP